LLLLLSLLLLWRGASLGVTGRGSAQLSAGIAEAELMRKSKQSASAGSLGVYSQRQPGFTTHPALRPARLKIDRSSEELQRWGGLVVGDRGLKDSEAHDGPSKPAPGKAWGTIELPAEPESPTTALMSSWPKWARPGFLEEVPPRLEQCRKRLREAEHELRRAEANGGVFEIHDAAPLQASVAAVQLDDAGRGMEQTDLEPKGGMDLPLNSGEDDELQADLDAMEAQMDSLDAKLQAVGQDQLLAKQRRQEQNEKKHGALKDHQQYATVLAARVLHAEAEGKRALELIKALRSKLGVSEGAVKGLRTTLSQAKAELQGQLSTARAVAADFRDKLLAAEQAQDVIQERVWELEEANENLVSRSHFAERRLEELEACQKTRQFEQEDEKESGDQLLEEVREQLGLKSKETEELMADKQSAAFEMQALQEQLGQALEHLGQALAGNTQSAACEIQALQEQLAQALARPAAADATVQQDVPQDFGGWEFHEASSSCLSNVPQVLLVRGLGSQAADSTLFAAKCRMDRDTQELALQPLRPCGPPQMIPLSSVVAIHEIGPADNMLSEEGVSLEVQNESSTLTIQLLAVNKESAHELLTALCDDTRLHPGFLLEPPASDEVSFKLQMIIT